MTLSERFWSRVNKDGPVHPKMGTPCWLWTAGTRRGYGQFHSHGTAIGSHRFAYQEVIGPIPVGLELDHLCRVLACVNPTHLEPVTHAENVRRGEAGKYHSTHPKDRCMRGHPFSGANVRIRPNGSRECVECERDRHRASYARLLAKRAALPQVPRPPRRSTHCENGHPMTTVTWGNNPPRQTCRVCRQAKDRKRSA